MVVRGLGKGERAMMDDSCGGRGCVDDRWVSGKGEENKNERMGYVQRKQQQMKRTREGTLPTGTTNKRRKNEMEKGRKKGGKGCGRGDDDKARKKRKEVLAWPLPLSPFSLSS